MSIKEKNSNEITMKEVARLAGVSQSVVSAILRNDRSSSIRYSDSTHEKVMEVVRKFKFRPHFSGRSLITGKLNTIGTLVHQWRWVSRNIYHGISDRATRLGQIIVMGILPPEDFKEDPAYIPKILAEKITDGFLVLDNLPSHIEDMIVAHNIPAVWINTQKRDKGNCVTYDEYGGMLKAVSHFKSLGKKHIAYLGWPGDSRFYWHAEREKGLNDASEKYSLSPVQFPEIKRAGKNSSTDMIRNTAKELVNYLKANPELDAFIVNDPLWGAALYRAAEVTGKKIPDDIAVLSIHLEKQVHTMIPMLSYLSLNRFEAGARGVDMLLDQIAGKPLPDKPAVLEYEIRSLESA